MGSSEPVWGIIGGTGLTAIDSLEVDETLETETVWGAPSAPLRIGRLGGRKVVFLARHGDPHRIPPHRVNYRANIEALRQAGVDRIIAVNAVGSIHPAMTPSSLVLPDQIIDYTWGRAPSFHEENLEHAVHVDFTWPYSESIRDALRAAAAEVDVAFRDGGVYACTQGPRLETAAEIRRLEQDGSDVVGMTAMPEAVLAREAELDYACLALVVNWAAGRTSEVITMDDIRSNLDAGIGRVLQVLEACLRAD
ncbi:MULTISPECIES: S-methyl-5'-thioinosine phosphorylase [Halomonadaceae]|uniref:Probable S-methyl-5'-thioinosine phosphorylase n=1 Tax=Vreelandella halophila TaxID=86177 RepID=A0A9X5B5X6_9GAMM|nr:MULTISPECIES: S-methyl-5'-thioinosine phosphorylase [Halomonas]MYL26968.1 S-methyl-5'-thioinosine phosphorylase [Halomonas utahensis]MYL74229.1 S-methyl-5'-thioinosine phosphorylase [Halomonas sp. 22501_18_FS]